MKGKEEDLQVTGRKGLAMCMFVWPSPVPGHHSLSYFSLIKSFPDYLCICTLFSANSWRDLDVGEQSSAPAARVGLGKGTLARSAGCCSEWGWLPPATRQWPCGVPGGVVDGGTRGECVSAALEQVSSRLDQTEPHDLGMRAWHLGRDSYLYKEGNYPLEQVCF